MTRRRVTRHGGGRAALVVYCVCAVYLYSVGALLAWAVLPAVIGMMPTLIVSESMAPRIAAGDVVLGSSAGGTQLRPGVVVTFDDPGHPGRLLTHRVVQVNRDGTYRTRGDANLGVDSSAVKAERVRRIGKLLVPAVGVPVMWIRTHAWLKLTLWVAGTLFAAAYLCGYARRPPRAATWSTTLARPPAPESQPLARGRRSDRRVPKRRRVPRLAATAAVAGVVLGIAVPPRVATSHASFGTTTDNPGNLLEAGMVGPPSGFTVTQECTQSAAVTFRSATSAQGQGTSQTLSTPAGVTAGDLLLAQIVVRDGGTPSVPAGWSLLRSDGGGPSSSLYYRVATASEPASASWDTGGSVRWAGGMGAWSGTDTATPITATSGAVGTLAAPGVTTTRPNQTLVGFFAQRHDGGFTGPASMTERWDRASNQSGSSAHQVGSRAADELFTDVGATGSRTATGSGGGNIAQLVALNRPPDTFDGLAEWTASPWTEVTGYELVRRVGAVEQATYNITPRTATSQLDPGLAPATTYTYDITSRIDTWSSAVASQDLTTSSYCP